MKRRVVSLWLTHLSTDRLTRRPNCNWPGRAETAPAGERPFVPERPLAVTVDQNGRIVLAGVNRAAAASGLTPGMALADARAVRPNFDTVPLDPAADAALLRRLAVWCGRYTPWVSVDGADGLFLDITGCAHLFGGEKALLTDIIGRLSRAGYGVRAALADTPGAAWAVARYGDAGVSGAVVPSRGAPAALAALPPAALRLDAATAAGLDRLGLRRIDALYNMPRAPLAARFGMTVARRLDQALGYQPEAISPLDPPTPYRARLAFAEPLGLVDDIARGLRHLLTDICAQLDRGGQGCRRLDLTLYRVDGTVQTAQIGAARPARDADRLARLFAERIGNLDPGFGVEVMTLSAPVTEALAPSQIKAFTRSDAHAASMRAERVQELSPLMDRLGNRLGFGRVVQLQARESHVPEKAAQPVSVLADTDKGRFDWPAKPARPLRLLNRPERLDAIAAVPKGEPGDPPAQFQWRRVNHRIRHASGPERIAPEWWQSGRTAKTRDYWRVEDTDGRRFWIYRHGLLRDNQTPDWYLHGLYA